jgi:hypothetical protein
MAKPGDRFGPQTIPEPAKEGHLSKFSSPGGDKYIGLYTVKYPKKAWDHRRVVLTISIEGDDDLVALLKAILEPCPEGRTLSQVKGVFQDRCPIGYSNHFRFVLRPVVHDDGIDLERLNLLQDLAKGSLGIMGWD